MSQLQEEANRSLANLSFKLPKKLEQGSGVDKVDVTRLESEGKSREDRVEMDRLLKENVALAAENAKVKKKERRVLFCYVFATPVLEAPPLHSILQTTSPAFVNPAAGLFGPDGAGGRA